MSQTDRPNSSRRRRSLLATAGLLVATSVAAALLSSCGASSASTCSTDDDCTGDRLCISDRCRRECSGDDDCTRPGFSCQGEPHDDGDEVVDVCLSEDAGSDDLPPTCDNASQCQDRLDDPRAECGIGGRCIIPPRHSILVEDLTSVDPESPGPDGGLGADIAAVVAAEGPSAASGVAWGDTLLFEPANPDRIESDSHLDGSKPTLTDSGECVTGDFESATTQLGGEGGELLVGLRDENGDHARVPDDGEVVVIEWGANCGVETDQQDRYRVSLCVHSNQSPDPDEQCDRQLGTGSGFSTFSIAGDDSE